jgi:CheY-like chemotaxis protein/Tfp pilus assembly protein PilZ
MITDKPKNILVADDSKFFRNKLSLILSEGGHNVKCVSDGGGVKKEIGEHPNDIDALILDLQMPNIDGFEVLEWMKENAYRGLFPVLVVTGVYKPGEVVDRLKALGVRGFITKDFTPEQIIHCLNRILLPKEADERREPRLPISIPVYFTVEGKGNVGTILNISASGLFLQTSLEFLPGTELKLKFILPDSDRLFLIEGIVNWTTPSKAGSRLFDGAGIQFTSISDKNKEGIRVFVEKENEKISRFLA